MSSGRGAESAGRDARRRVVILGAAGRDFHDFNLVYRSDPTHQVVAFTATQIPNIEGRRYPPALSGPLYPDGIPIYPEAELERLIAEHDVDDVVFSYSDVSHEEVMHRASRALAAGAGFRLLAPRRTMLRSAKPVVSVCAVRTGSGKSPTSRRVARALAAAGLRVAVVRHPMPYGDLARQAVQRFAALEDLAREGCTIEEMEEYEPHLLEGRVVFAGVDYELILRRAEAEADVLLWDGGNNDLPFILPDLELVLVDPHRPGHETRFHPGEANLLRAHAVVMTKLDTADPASAAEVRATVRRVNPRATLVETEMRLRVEHRERLAGARALVIEDGPTLTHGGMGFGAGAVAARAAGARELVDPRAFAVGSLAGVLARNPQIDRVLPAMGYGSEQMRELERTIAATPCDVVVIATPVDLGRVLNIERPTCRVTYETADHGSPTLDDVLGPFLAGALRGAAP